MFQTGCNRRASNRCGKDNWGRGPEWASAIAQKFGECMARPFEQQFCLVGIDVGSKKTVWCISQVRVRRVHAWLPGERFPAHPRDLGLLRSRNIDVSHRAHLSQQFGTRKASVRLDRSGNVRGPAAEHHGNFALEVKAGEIIVPLLGQMQTVTDKYQGRLEVRWSRPAAGDYGHVLANTQRDCRAVR